MPVQVSYPGVYVQEIPISNPTVIGVTTSSTAFVDFFPSGPLGQAVQINSWSDFQRIFGGLDPRSESSYAIMQYFFNGGQVAWVIRVIDPASASASPQLVIGVTVSVEPPTSNATPSAPLSSEDSPTSNATPSTPLSTGAAVLGSSVLQISCQVVSPDSALGAGPGSISVSSYAAYLSIDGGISFNLVQRQSTLPSPATGRPDPAATFSVQVPKVTQQVQGVIQVVATDANGNLLAGATSAPFTIVPGLVKVNTPIFDTQAAGGPLTLSLGWSWQGSVTPSYYSVLMSTDGGSTFAPATFASPAPPLPLAGTVTTAKVTLPVPATSSGRQGTVVFQITATDVNGNPIASGQTALIQVAQTAGMSTIAVSAPAPGASETPGSFTVSWEAPAPAPKGTVASYNVLLSTDDGATFQTIPGLSLDATATTATVTELPAGTQSPTSQAVIQVVALDAGGNRLGLGQSGVFALTAPSSPPGTSPFVIRAISPGDWGNDLQVSLTPVPASGGAGLSSFNLSVQQVVSGAVVGSESYQGLTYGDPNDPNYAPKILAASQLIQLVPYPATFPGLSLSVPEGAFTTKLAGGTDGSVVSLESAASALGNAFAVSNPLGALDQIAPSVFNLLCLPWLANLSGGAELSIATQAMTFCGQRQAFYIMDIPESVSTPDLMRTWANDYISESNYFAAVYFPRLILADPLNKYRARNSPASGTLAGIYALNDTNAGVWAAPAGVDAVLQGIMSLAHNLTDAENGELNSLGINCLRTFPVYNNVVWGARTLAGADQLESEWKYIPVRRLIDYIEQSLVQSLRWAVFQPNGPQLWTRISVEVGTFLSKLYSQGALYGATPSQAYFVNCDGTTTTPADMAQGIVNIVVGVAPVEPAEFVILTIQQSVGQPQAS